LANLDIGQSLPSQDKENKMPTNMIMKQKISTRLALLFLTFLVLLNTHCAPAGKQFGIIFSANLGGNQDLYRAYSPDFQSVERLTLTPVDSEQDLKITKHGERILFSVLGTNLGWGTYIMDLKAKSTTELSDSALGLRSIKPLVWSFDENQAVLLETQTAKIYTVSLDKKSVKELKIPHTFDFSTITGIDYSPDGKQLAYTEYHNPTPPLSTKSSFVFDFETKLVIPLVDNNTATCDESKWSPNGKRVLLYCDLSTDGIAEDNHIYILDVIGNNPVTIKEIANLPCGRSPGAKFAWSPDGTQFVAAYCKMNDDPRSLFIFNSDGSVNRGFSSPANQIYISEMVWSPDGEKILYTAGKDKNSLNIYMVNSDGSNNHIITTQPSNYSELSIYSP
jgi:Tol biopolymer transport system component